MVDNLTQSCLYPLHRFLFDILIQFPNDATFDQGASVKRCFEKARLANKSFGYDLSAATDRLPMSLQVAIISSFFGRSFATSWGKLLVNRPYNLNNSEDYYYKVGQPMGALSS
jgi:hypothetical protein